MWQTTYTHIIKGDSRLLVIGSQIDILTLDLSLGHNLYYKYSNGPCEPNLYIYILIAF